MATDTPAPQPTPRDAGGAATIPTAPAERRCAHGVLMLHPCAACRGEGGTGGSHVVDAISRETREHLTSGDPHKWDGYSADDVAEYAAQCLAAYDELRAAINAPAPQPAPAEAAGVVFVLLSADEQSVLMERCPKKARIHGGEWFLPGGRLEADEGPDAALMREMHEELTVWPIAPERLRLVDGGRVGAPFVVQPYVVREWDGGALPPRVLDSGAELRWVPLAEARQSPVYAVRAILDQLAARTPAAPASEAGGEWAELYLAAESAWGWYEGVAAAHDTREMPTAHGILGGLIGPEKHARATAILAASAAADLGADLGGDDIYRVGEGPFAVPARPAPAPDDAAEVGDA